MPFDPFFSSENKNHYVHSDGAKDALREFRSKSREEQFEIVKDLKLKSQTVMLSAAEKLLIRDYRFRAKMFSNAVNRRRQYFSAKKIRDSGLGLVIFSGHNTGAR